MVKIIYICMLLSTFLFSNVILKSPSSFYDKEAFIFSFEIYGNNISIPKIEKIDNYEVSQVGNSSSYSNINGRIQKKIIKRYVIYPKDNFIIPSFIFKIDGVNIKSLSKNIYKEKIKKTKSSNFDLTIKSNKNSLYIGEEALLTIIFKYKKDLQLTQLALDKPNFDNFWFKSLDNNKQYEDNDYIIQKLYFNISAQKAGKLTIPAVKVILKILDPYSNSFSFFSNSEKEIKVYSNDLTFDVKPLPKGIVLFGDFKINSLINKSVINEGEALSYKINIDGFGNINDLDDVKINISNTSIYENKAIINKSLKKISYSKTFSIISSDDFIIPSYTLSFFDKKTQSVKSVKTKEYKIKVIKNKEVKNDILQKNLKLLKDKVIEKKIVYKNNYKINILFFILGSIFTILICALYKLLKNKKSFSHDEMPLIKKIKNCNNKNELLNLLAKYLFKDKELDEKIYLVEKSDKNGFSKNKKDIIIIVKNLQKKGQL